MVYCCVPKCSSCTRKCRLFRLPTDKTRRAVWIKNSKVNVKRVTSNSRICEKHFSTEQYESRRQDGKVKLKPNAVPTIFEKEKPKEEPIVQPAKKKPKYVKLDFEFFEKLAEAKRNEVATLKKELSNKDEEIKRLQLQLDQKNKDFDAFKSFLSDEQISNVIRSAQKLNLKWSKEGIIAGLKLRIALGLKRYQYLLSTNYPSPAYSTIKSRMNFMDSFFQSNVTPISKKEESNAQLCVKIINNTEVLDCEEDNTDGKNKENNSSLDNSTDPDTLHIIYIDNENESIIMKECNNMDGNQLQNIVQQQFKKKKSVSRNETSVVNQTIHDDHMYGKCS